MEVIQKYEVFYSPDIEPVRAADKSAVEEIVRSIPAEYRDTTIVSNLVTQTGWSPIFAETVTYE